MKPVRLTRITLTVALVTLMAACGGGSNAQSGTESVSPSSSAGPVSPSPTPSTSLASWPDKAVNGRIAFGRWLDAANSTRAIFVINPDGTGEQQLTQPSSGVVDNHPDWSPDGSQIAFERCTDQCESWVMNADGSDARSLGVTCPDDNASPVCESGAPTWSPDGKTLASNRAFGSVKNDFIQFSQLVLVDAQDGRVIRVIDATDPYTGDTGEAGWSPDGTQLVLGRDTSSLGDPPSSRALFVIDADGTGLRQLTPWDLGAGDHPVWSPDGQLILFRTISGSDDQYGNLYTIHPDGTGLRQLTHYPPNTIVLSYSFSPDGQWITYAQFGVGGEPDIFIMRVDGTDLGAVTQTALADSAPDWGPAQ